VHQSDFTRGSKSRVRVFSFNRGIGYASSGVEYAQKYRAEIFEEIEEVDGYFVFLNFLSTNIKVYTELMNMDSKKVIWIYNFLSERPNVSSKYTINEFLENLSDKYTIHEKSSNRIIVDFGDNQRRYEVSLLPSKAVDVIREFDGIKLLKVYHFDSSLSNIEFFHKNQVVRRVFYKEDERVAFEQFYSDGEITITLIGGKILYGKMAFFKYFIQKLNINQDDVVIIDRPLGSVEGIVPVLAGKTRLFSVIHAEHYNRSLSIGSHILWNNNYEYVLDHSKLFESIIVATDRQRDILIDQLKEDKIRTIPVGYINEIIDDVNYVHFALITVSRLASEKHIDIVIKAVANVRKIYPEVTLDVYGEGGERGKLQELIEDLNATEFVHLKGHQEMSGTYGKYGAYVSASTSEGFGLSLLEAIAESLPIIGADVDYGNREFITSEKNGLLYENTNLSQLTSNLEQSLLKFFSSDIPSRGRIHSREKAGHYLKSEIVKKWRSLLKV
jgi:poly(glycerol-phosphate) alpha-glucosyltransferase